MTERDNNLNIDGQRRPLVSVIMPANGSVKYLGSDIHMLGDGYRAWEKCVKLLSK